VVIAGRAYDWACVSRLYTGDGSGCIVEATGCALLRRAKVGWIGTYRLGRYVSSFMGTGVPTIGPSSISTTLPSATLCGNVLDAPCRSCLSVVFGYDCPPEARHSVRLLPRCGASRLVEAEIEILQLTYVLMTRVFLSFSRILSVVCNAVAKSAAASRRREKVCRKRLFRVVTGSSN